MIIIFIGMISQIHNQEKDNKHREGRRPIKFSMLPYLRWETIQLKPIIRFVYMRKDSKLNINWQGISKPTKTAIGTR